MIGPAPELIAQIEHALLNQQVMCAVAGAQQQAGDPSAQPIPPKRNRSTKRETVARWTPELSSDLRGQEP